MIKSHDIHWIILLHLDYFINRYNKSTHFNPFFPNAPFLYPLKTSENRKVFWCFQGVEKECIENYWVNSISFLFSYRVVFGILFARGSWKRALTDFLYYPLIIQNIYQRSCLMDIRKRSSWDKFPGPKRYCCTAVLLQHLVQNLFPKNKNIRKLSKLNFLGMENTLYMVAGTELYAKLLSN